MTPDDLRALISARRAPAELRAELGRLAAQSFQLTAEVERLRSLCEAQRRASLAIVDELRRGQRVAAERVSAMAELPDMDPRALALAAGVASAVTSSDWIDALAELAAAGSDGEVESGLAHLRRALSIPDFAEDL